MKWRPVFSDALPILCLLCFQALIAFVVVAMDMRSGFSSSNALYAAWVQALATLVYLTFRLVRRARERSAVNRASRDPLRALLPRPRNSTSSAWRVLVERQREEAERLLVECETSARDDLDSFILSIHAMKAPVAALSLLADRAQRDGASPRPMDIKLEAEELDRLLELALGRIRLGDFERDATIEPVALREVAASCIRRSRRLFIARGISVDLAEEGAIAETDRKWLLFILDQLVVNAAKYATKAVTVRIFRSAKSVGLFVEDDGPGIPQRDRDRVFSRSFVGKTGRDADSAGISSSGYGLYLASRAALKLGARLELEAGENGGTRASVALPLARGRFD